MENELQYLFDALKTAQPSWKAEGIGVRGNPVETNKQQTQIIWPDATLTRSTGRDQSVISTPGAPELPPTVPPTG